MTLKGIDVSNWQGASFDWAAERAQGVDFAFIKATEGIGFADPDFPRNWETARARGLVRGAYHFLHPDQPIEAQAAWFLDHVHTEGLKPGDLLAVDYEITGGLDAAAAAAAAEHFVDIINSAEPLSTVVYTTQDLALGGYCDGLGGSPLWLVTLGTSSAPPPPPWKLISFEQTGQRGVDQDTGFFDDMDQLRKLGLRASDPGPVPEKDLHTISDVPAAADAAAAAVSTDHLAQAGQVLAEAKTLMPDGQVAYHMGKLWEAALHALIGIGQRL